MITPRGYRDKERRSLEAVRLALEIAYDQACALDNRKLLGLIREALIARSAAQGAATTRACEA